MQITPSLIAVFGIVMLLGIVYVVGSGLKGKQAKGHKVIALIVLVMALIHAVSGWVMQFELLPLIAGSLLVVFFCINVLSGMNIIKLPLKVHKIIGHIVLWMALAHAISGVYGNLIK